LFIRSIYLKYIVILGLLAFTWFIAYTTGGVNSTINIFYLVIVLAARFGGAKGGILVGLIGGILGGPLLPDDVLKDVSQNTSEWSIRLGFYVFIGLATGTLFSSLQSRNQEIQSKKEDFESKNGELIEFKEKIIKQKTEIQEQRNELEEQKEQGKRFGTAMVEALVQAIEVRDAYTSGHCRRVSEISGRIGERVGLKDDELGYLKLSATLHDIGKIGIPEEILNKEGKLTPDEYDIMKKHPALGAKILGEIPYAGRILDGVLHHHERLDGKGYPYGLSGDEIGLQARIIAVSDVWDALTSNRAYRDAMPYTKALQVMESGRGSQFDPVILDHFLQVIGASEQKRSAG
jgi:HD-GYP domain-containing protein (c-di-GMP phosphodiesterase class II)